LAQTRANLPPLEKALAQTRNQLAVLIGKFPDEVRLPELDLAAFRLPQNLPVSLPSDLVRQRPDIRSAETLLHQTNARLGVAQADAEAAARESLDMTIKQLQFGSASYLALFNAQRQYEQAKIGLVQAQAARYADTAALFQALGGGWWEREGQGLLPAKTAN